jgi:hypothetical protein
MMEQSKGRKRPRLEETQGLVVPVTVHAADVMDGDGVPLLRPPAPTQAQLLRLAHGWLDADDTGRGKGQDGLEKTLGGTTPTVRPLRGG